MSTMVKDQLQSGVIFGHAASGEYIYLPGGEVGVGAPLCVLETKNERRDITLSEAVRLVTKLSLRPIRHPRLGDSAY